MLFWKQILFIVKQKECAFLSVSYHREGTNQDVALDVVCLSFFRLSVTQISIFYIGISDLFETTSP